MTIYLIFLIWFILEINDLGEVSSYLKFMPDYILPLLMWLSVGIYIFYLKA